MGGKIAINSVITTTCYTISDYDYLITSNVTNGTTTYLPAAISSGRVLIFKNINTATLTIDGNDTETIDGLTTTALTQWQSIQLIDYMASAWVRIN